MLPNLHLYHIVTRPERVSGGPQCYGLMEPVRPIYHGKNNPPATVDATFVRPDGAEHATWNVTFWCVAARLSVNQLT